jgi:hypothetical protein
MAIRIQLRRGLSTEWTSVDPILAEGEMGLETDTGKFKVGNGIDEWSLRPYASGPTGPTGPTGAASTVTGPTGPSYYSSVNTQAGDSYTLQLSDAANLVVTTSSSAVTVEIPLNSTTDFPVGASVEILQSGTGQVTVTGASGVTITTPSLARTRARYSLISAIHVTTDEWVVVGDLAIV